MRQICFSSSLWLTYCKFWPVKLNNTNSDFTTKHDIAFENQTFKQNSKNMFCRVDCRLLLVIIIFKTVKNQVSYTCKS